ncbi:MAG: TrmH family RNA methyltransferase [Bacteroidota bacterium]
MHRTTQFREERADIDERLKQIQQNRHPIALLLDSLQDWRNVASIFRLADAARIEKIYLYQSIISPAQQKKLNRMARATQQYVPFETITQLDQIPDHYRWVAIEITNQSISYTHFQRNNQPNLLVVGNEQRGVQPTVLERCETALHIPMHGINTSMNVAMSAAIVTYHLLSHYKI